MAGIYDYTSHEELIGRVEVAEELLGKLIAIMDRTFEFAPARTPARTYDSSYGGGDCSKHGRYYGTCHSCIADQEKARNSQLNLYMLQKESDLCELAKQSADHLKINR